MVFLYLIMEVSKVYLTPLVRFFLAIFHGNGGESRHVPR